MSTILTLLILLTSGSYSAAAGTQPPLILVGPNVRVNKDTSVPHVETSVAIDPANSKNMLGGAITVTGPSEGRGPTCRTYASTDGGFTWTDATFAEQVEFGGVDPQVAYGLSGIAYFVAIAYIPGREGLYFYRSEDGGKIWQQPLYLGRGDHEMIAVDHSSSEFAGRVYITAETATFADKQNFRGRESKVVLFRSDDGGRTFGPPAIVATSQGKGLMAENLLVLSDGTLFVPMREYPNPPQDQTTPTHRLLFSASTDGGDSFSATSRILETYLGPLADFYKRFNAGDLDVTYNPSFAADTHSVRYHGRLYVAWNDRRNGANRILFSYSGDQGKTWSVQRMVGPSVPPRIAQYQAKIEVNNEGTIGVMWFQTTTAKDQDRYDLYFSASVDGGESFLHPVCVSSRPSLPGGTANIRPIPFRMVTTDESLRVDFLSGFSRWRAGGEYIGLAADGLGAFHPFWPDSRSGVYQIMTAQIRVSGRDSKKLDRIEKSEESINRDVTLVFDSIEVDAEKQEAILLIRLRNISTRALYGPLTVVVKSLTDPAYAFLNNSVSVKRILNSTNGKPGVGAVFDYTSALRDFNSLEPGALTEAMPWRLKFDNLKAATFPIEVEVIGFVSKRKDQR
jgi:BNR repeat-like domain